MRHVTEYRDAASVRRVLDEVRRAVTRPWTLMEVCGGQTHSIIRHGLDRLLPPEVELVHGPGCPVCVTPLELVDKALALAARPDVILASFGDMLRVPGSFVDSGTGPVADDLFAVKSRGGDVRIVYSPLDALAIAREHPDRTVVFFGIGFETTAPANGVAVQQAAREGVGNFCMLVSHVTVPPAIRAVMGAPDCRVQGFLAAGHVCTVMGVEEYAPLASEFRVPIVVTGFEPLDLASGVLAAVRQLESGRSEVVNAYRRSVAPQGNPAARAVIRDVFVRCDRAWRGIGTIPGSGYRLSPRYARFDAELRFPDIARIASAESADCRSGEVLQGRLKPDACPAFGTTCTPGTPLGATMVSSEGACAAYYRYGRVPR